ncbi:hypothetical protein AWZ03_000676 [Drosophila navojoa]|uniref:Uncharacterized protein n=1 Tax=Drosophila navojoa TaxID=7232 RepID=A0A484BWQ5_DRONA|nr:uncharacterized protein LOC108650446 isoform X2 [Drosophila navojoa]TDG53133.1 hypothetical protein AWZ03_000676 [Drosophila navojoa]
MLRAVISISQRGKLPLTLLSAQGIAQNKLRFSTAYCRPLVRFYASDDSKIKGSLRGGPTGIIGNMDQSASMGNVGGGDSFPQPQPAALGGDPTHDYGKATSKRAAVTSQLQAATHIITESEKHGRDESKSSSSSPMSGEESNKVVGQSNASGPSDPERSGPGSGNKMVDDAIKNLQDAAANLPSKEQVEKFVFRTLAFIYDLLFLTVNWTIRFIDEKVVQNKTVRLYWKKFHEKMEEAKKD